MEQILDDAGDTIMMTRDRLAQSLLIVNLPVFPWTIDR